MEISGCPVYTRGTNHIQPETQFKSLFPKRTLKSIKGQRQSQKYSGKVQDIWVKWKQRPIKSHRHPPPRGTKLHSALTSAISDLFSRFNALTNPDYNSDHLDRIFQNFHLWPSNKIFDELHIYLLETFPPTTAAIKCKRRPEQALSKHRADYTRTQRAWTKNPGKCIKTILKITDSPPTKECMINFWQNDQRGWPIPWNPGSTNDQGLAEAYNTWWNKEVLSGSQTISGMDLQPCNLKQSRSKLQPGFSIFSWDVEDCLIQH